MISSEYTIEDLLRIMQRLRDPKDGCPWDVAQSFQSIVPSTLEECYELAHAIESEDYAHVAEELGDVLFQVIFYAQLGMEQGLFSFEQVVSVLSAKLLRRHPHVFAEGEIEGRVSHSTDVEEVKQSWESIKRGERRKKSLHGILDDVPRALPALPRAQKIQKRAATVNFDWPDYEGARAKIQEELLELDEAVRSQSVDCIEDEMGDLLFSCVNASRHLGLDAEASLRRATAKFERRFQEMVRLAELDSRTLNDFGNAELDSMWRQAKINTPDTQSSEKP
jgi:ATP diphosphatase